MVLAKHYPRLLLYELWNSLHVMLRNIDSLHEFKRHLKAHLSFFKKYKPSAADFIF